MNQPRVRNSIIELQRIVGLLVHANIAIGLFDEPLELFKGEHHEAVGTGYWKYASMIPILTVGNLGGGLHVFGVAPFCPLQREPLARFRAEDGEVG